MDADNRKKRRRFKQTQSLQERLLQAANLARAAAEQMPNSVERAKLLNKAREAEASLHLERWLSKPSPGP